MRLLLVRWEVGLRRELSDITWGMVRYNCRFRERGLQVGVVGKKVGSIARAVRGIVGGRRVKRRVFAGVRGFGMRRAAGRGGGE